MKQLQLVSRWEEDKEQRFANEFRIAENELNAQKQKLQSLEQYRVEYLQQIQSTGKEGVDAQHYHQHLSFVAKLDKACEQQNEVIARADMVAQQRKAKWLQQQQRRKAVDKLIENKQSELAIRAARQEQSMLDELANQRFFRMRKQS